MNAKQQNFGETMHSLVLPQGPGHWESERARNDGAVEQSLARERKAVDTQPWKSLSHGSEQVSHVDWVGTERTRCV